jgi:flagellar hook-length control protein FliK
MKFTFTDLGSSILDVVNSKLRNQIEPKGKSADSQTPLFASRLDRIIEKGTPVENKVLSDLGLDSASQDNSAVVEFLNQHLENKKGISFLSELKKLLLIISGGDLSNISIDENGLAGLKILLSKAGFNDSDVDTLIKDLKETLEEQTLTLDLLFDQFFDLAGDLSDIHEDETEQFLEASALPFLTSIFNALDIPDDTIAQMLNAADKADKGISLDVMIAHLQDFQKQVFHSHTTYQTQADAKQVHPLLKSIGVQIETRPSEAMTLDDLVRAFENLHKSETPSQKRQWVFQKSEWVSQKSEWVSQKSEWVSKNVIQQPQADLMIKPAGEGDIQLKKQSTRALEALLNGLDVQKGSDKTALFDFSADQIKEQFKNALLASEQSDKNPKGLFAKDNAISQSKDLSAKEGIKAFISHLEEKAANRSGVEDALTHFKQAGQKSKNRLSSLSEQTQTSFTDGKTAESQTGQTIIKSKTTFKSLPNFVTQQVSKSIVRAVNQGENILKIQLKPPELGRLMVTIDNSGNSMRVNITTENAAAREILVSNVNEIRTVLSNSGVNLERFDVDMNSDFRQSMADARQQAGQSNKRQRHRSRAAVAEIENDLTRSAVNLMEAIDQGESMHFVA